MIGLTGTALSEENMIRAKDISRVGGTRDNVLFGMGLIVGLDGTGDSRRFEPTMEMIVNMLERFGVSLPSGSIAARNVAAVNITAILPPFATPGDKIDVTASSMGDAKSLKGGVLLLAPLHSAGGNVYAVAQGPVSLEGFTAQGVGASTTVGHVTSGVIRGGALVEQTVPMNPLRDDGMLELILFPEHVDYSTASELASAINKSFNEDTAEAISPSTIRITPPPVFSGTSMVEFISLLEQVPLKPDNVAKIIVNERTGTVVVGGNVRISPVTVTYGDLKVEIDTVMHVSQPYPFSEGETVTIVEGRLDITEEPAQAVTVEERATVEDLIGALIDVGATARDIAAVLGSVKQAGALYGELIIE